MYWQNMYICAIMALCEEIGKNNYIIFAKSMIYPVSSSKYSLNVLRILLLQLIIFKILMKTNKKSIAFS